MHTIFIFIVITPVKGPTQCTCFLSLTSGAYFEFLLDRGGLKREGAQERGGLNRAFTVCNIDINIFHLFDDPSLNSFHKTMSL